MPPGRDPVDRWADSPARPLVAVPARVGLTAGTVRIRRTRRSVCIFMGGGAGRQLSGEHGAGEAAIFLFGDLAQAQASRSAGHIPQTPGSDD